jgi:hypothetical protein
MRRWICIPLAGRGVRMFDLEHPSDRTEFAAFRWIARLDFPYRWKRARRDFIDVRPLPWIYVGGGTYAVRKKSNPSGDRVA